MLKDFSKKICEEPLEDAICCIRADQTSRHNLVLRYNLPRRMCAGVVFNFRFLQQAGSVDQAWFAFTRESMKKEAGLLPGFFSLDK